MQNFTLQLRKQPEDTSEQTVPDGFYCRFHRPVRIGELSEHLLGLDHGIDISVDQQLRDVRISGFSGPELSDGSARKSVPGF